MSELRHVVLFGFKEGTSAEDIRKVEEGFAALPSKIDGIKEFEWGTNVSIENKNQGFSHCFLVTFEDEAARDAYIPHPAHQDFVGVVRPLLTGSLVLDYWSRPE
jgi:quinol monooxygenase YgiN